MENDRLEEIRRRHGIALVVQFGSTVGGAVHADSDLDVGVLFEGPPRYDDVPRIASEISEALPGRDIDLAVLNRADPLFLKQVTDRSRLLAGSPRRFAEFQIYAFRRYQDHRRYLALERDYVRRALGPR